MKSAGSRALKRCHSAAQEPLANRPHVQLAGAEKIDEARKPTGQCLRKGFIFAEGLRLQPQSQDDKSVRCPVQSAVKTCDEPVAPQDWQCVVAELALVLGFVNFP